MEESKQSDSVFLQWGCAENVKKPDHVGFQYAVKDVTLAAGKVSFFLFFGPGDEPCEGELDDDHLLGIQWGSRMQRLMSSAQVLLMHLAHGCNIRHGIQCNTIIYEYNTLAHRCNIGHGIKCNIMNMSLCHGI